MKVFLVSPDEKKFLYNAGDRAPLGIFSISSALSAEGIVNEVFDLNHDSEEEFIKNAEKEKPDWVGLSIVSSPSFKQMKLLAKRIKQVSSTTKIVVGGAHVSAMPESFEGIADATVIGYGENAILEVIKGKVGIVNGGGDINEFPRIKRTEMNMDRYSMYSDDPKTGKKLRTATMVTSRGCPFNCVFCASHEKKVQFRNLDEIREEVKDIKKIGYNVIYILDENFVIKEEHFNGVTEIMKKEEMMYRIEMRVDKVTEEIAKRLKETGCIYVGLGLESGDNEILRKANKGTTVEENKKAIEIFHKYDIPVKGFFIIGLPGETQQTAGKTIEFADSMKGKGLTFADFYALTPFPGSPIWENPEKFGIKILSEDFDDFLQKGNPIIETKDLTKKEIQRFVEEGRSRWGKKGKIIVTGGCGFLGKQLVEAIKEDYEVVIVDKKEGKDILNLGDLEELKADYVIHLAALMRTEKVEEMFDVNVKGTLNVLELCKKMGAKLIFISSAAVYGNVESPIRENASTNPESFYGVTKLLGEELCKIYNKNFNIQVIILRLFNPYGENQEKEFLVPSIISQLKNEKIILRDAFSRRDYIYVGDIVEAIIKSLSLEKFETMNIGTGKSHSVQELAIKMVEGKKVEFSDMWKVENNIYANINKARKLLDWEPTIGLDEGLRRVIKYAKQNPNNGHSDGGKLK